MSFSEEKYNLKNSQMKKAVIHVWVFLHWVCLLLYLPLSPHSWWLRTFHSSLLSFECKLSPEMSTTHVTAYFSLVQVSIFDDVSPEGSSDCKQDVYTEQHEATCLRPAVRCTCISRTLRPIRFPRDERRHRQHTPGSAAEDAPWLQLHRCNSLSSEVTHLVRLAAHICAAAVVGKGGRDKPSGAGVAGVLAVARAFKLITTFSLLHWQLAMSWAFGRSLKGTCFPFAHWGRKIHDEMYIDVQMFVCSTEGRGAQTSRWISAYHTRKLADTRRGFSAPQIDRPHSAALQAGHSSQDHTLES